MKTWVNVRILDSNVPMHASPSAKSQIICQLTDGPDVELTKATRGFVEIKLADGRHGFINSRVATFRTKTMSLRQGQEPLYVAPSVNSKIVATLEKGARIRTRDVGVVQDGIKWLHVNADGGGVGFVRGDVQVLTLGSTPRIKGSNANGFKNVLIGGVILLIGVVVTTGNYSAISHTGGPYLIAWGAILFGGIWLVKGLSQMNAFF